ncbi:MAG: low temperature requirement protein A [Bacteroidetes bacterium]|nr:low temperature requirement protein A [Bacteroidota bacterium]
MPNSSIVSPEDQTVTFVELFFDLVFVFSVTQVVSFFHHGVSWSTAGSAVLVFWLVWWAWTQFTWALNAANTDHQHIQIAMLLATAIAFFMAIAVPDAFGNKALWFAIPYVMVRLVGLHVYTKVTVTNEKQHEGCSLVCFGFNWWTHRGRDGRRHGRPDSILALGTRYSFRCARCTGSGKI